MLIELLIKNVSHAYHGVPALSSLNLEHKGTGIVALIGANGAGKSTLLRSIVGAQKLSTGKILLNQSELCPESPYRKNIGYLSEQNPLPNSLSVEEVLKTSALLHQVPYTQHQVQIEESLQACDLIPLRKRYCNTLSRGQRQRLGLASAIIHQPQVLVLDEVHSGLDPMQTKAMNSILRSIAKQTLIILSTHRLHEVEKLADYVWVLHHGELLKVSSISAWQKESISSDTALSSDTVLDSSPDSNQISNQIGANIYSTSKDSPSWSLENAYIELITSIN